MVKGVLLYFRITIITIIISISGDTHSLTQLYIYIYIYSIRKMYICNLVNLELCVYK